MSRSNKFLAGLGTAIAQFGNQWMQYAFQKGMLGEEIEAKKDLATFEDDLATAREKRLEELRVTSGKELAKFEGEQRILTETDPRVADAKKRGLQDAADVEVKSRKLSEQDKADIDLDEKTKLYKRFPDLARDKHSGSGRTTPDTFDVESTDKFGETKKVKMVWINGQNGPVSMPLDEYNTRMMRLNKGDAGTEPPPKAVMAAPGGLADAAAPDGGGVDLSKLSDDQLMNQGPVALETGLNDGTIWRDEDRNRVQQILTRYFPTPENEADTAKQNAAYGDAMQTMGPGF